MTSLLKSARGWETDHHPLRRTEGYPGLQDFRCKTREVSSKPEWVATLSLGYGVKAFGLVINLLKYEFFSLFNQAYLGKYNLSILESLENKFALCGA